MLPIGALPNRALPVLVELRRRQRFSMKEFTLASGVLAESAKALRLCLEGMELIEVRSLGRRGVVERMEISLTPRGQRLADIFSAANDVMAEPLEGRAGAKGARERG